MANERIRYRILSDDKMKEAGFIDIGEDWMREEFWSDIDLLFLVLLPKNGVDYAVVEVVDEETRCEYDYEYILSRNPEFKVALMSKERVDETISYLRNVGIVL